MSVFKYNMHMQIPKINALVIPPNSCPIPNINEEIIIAGKSATCKETGVAKVRLDKEYTARLFMLEF